jgi:hypothetical protein
MGLSVDAAMHPYGFDGVAEIDGFCASLVSKDLVI